MFACADFVQLAVVSVFRDVSDSLVITLTLLHEWHDLAERLERQVAEFIEAYVEQRVDHLFSIGQVQLAQLGFYFVIVFIDAQHPSDLVEQLRLAVQCIGRDFLPLGCEFFFLQSFAQLLPSRKFHQCSAFRVFGFLTGFLTAGIR